MKGNHQASNKSSVYTDNIVYYGAADTAFDKNQPGIPSKPALIRRVSQGSKESFKSQGKTQSMISKHLKQIERKKRRSVGDSLKHRKEEDNIGS